MGRTNIHSALQLLDRAGSDFERIAYIDYAGKLVYNQFTTLDQTDLESHIRLLRSGILGSWIRTDATGTVVCGEPDVPISVPKAVISPGLKIPGNENGASDKKTDDQGPAQKELVCVLISQGRSGNGRGKVVIEPSRERAAAHVMYEVLNGYSVVFTGAMLKKDIGKLHNEMYGIRVVNERKLLQTISEESSARNVGVWCDGTSFLY